MGKIKDLLDSPAKWIKGTHAEDAQGKRVLPEHPNACRWCLSGAIDKCYGVDTSEHDNVYMKICWRLGIPYLQIPQWNDSMDRRFEDIVKLITELDV